MMKKQSRKLNKKATTIAAIALVVLVVSLVMAINVITMDPFAYVENPNYVLTNQLGWLFGIATVVFAVMYLVEYKEERRCKK